MTSFTILFQFFAIKMGIEINMDSLTRLFSFILFDLNFDLNFCVGLNHTKTVVAYWIWCYAIIIEYITDCYHKNSILLRKVLNRTWEKYVKVLGWMVMTNNVILILLITNHEGTECMSLEYAVFLQNYKLKYFNHYFN